MIKKTNGEDVVICDVCGITSNEKIVQWVGRTKQHLCSKHKKQIYEYGMITDPTSRTTQDKNEYILHDDYAEIILRDRQNNIVASALIDLDDVEKCMQQKWSIGKDLAHNYVRAKNTKINTSLQRYVMNYNGHLDIDHINRNHLDNRKANLRIVSRTQNSANNGDHGIYQVSTGKWKVKLCRYSKTFYSGGSGFDTYDDAVAYRNNILKYIEEHKDELQKEFDKARKGRPTGVRLLPNGTWQTYYTVDGKRIRENGFPTMEAAANRRAEMTGGVPCVG